MFGSRFPPTPLQAEVADDQVSGAESHDLYRQIL